MPEGFSIGPLFVRFYGIILMLGAVAGAWLATREAKRRGYEPEIVWDLLTYLLIGGIIGARHLAYPYAAAILRHHGRLVSYSSPGCAWRCGRAGWASQVRSSEGWLFCIFTHAGTSLISRSGQTSARRALP